MEFLIGIACVGAITYYGYLMAKYFDAKAEEENNQWVQFQQMVWTSG